MASGEISRHKEVSLDRVLPGSRISVADGMSSVLSALASLKLTVVLFATLIFLVFVGTLAQVDHGIWHVVDQGYFRVWIGWVEFQGFERLVQMVYPVTWNLSGGFYFPGGYLIGTAMALNLLAAHAVRFQVNARGRRLWIGLVVIAAGLAITALVIRSGMDESVESELSPAFANGLWHVLRASLAGSALAGAYVLVQTYARRRWIESCLLLAVVLSLAGLSGWLMWRPEVRLDPSGLRILWQLIKGGAAGGVLLVGCLMAFRKRAGIVLLHGGVLLLLFSELWTGLTAVEGQMEITEGQATSQVRDIRSTELAVIDRSPTEHDRVTVVPGTLLAAAGDDGRTLQHEDLPFTIKVVDWYPNSRLQDARAGVPNVATAGHGLRHIAEPAKTASGVGSEPVDMASGYVELFSKEDNTSLGTYLISQLLVDQPIEVDGKTYELNLRFTQSQRPYSIALKDFRFDRYVGTNTPKNYSSLVQLRDPERNVDREFLIWMNNPLRYRGDTFYQADFDQRTEQTTVLQVVSNPGWMIPYVACMLVATGMLYHFGVALVRFTKRRDATADRQATIPDSRLESGSRPIGGLAATWFPLLVLLVFGGYLAGKMRPPRLPQHETQIYEFGKLPLAYEGRVKPFDTLARNSLQLLSGRQEIATDDDQSGSPATASPAGDGEKLPAIRWLLDVIAQTPAARQHRVFRIDNLELLDALGLPRRAGFRYSYAELDAEAVRSELDKQLELALATEQETRTLFQRKVVELANKRVSYQLLGAAFSSPQLRADRDQLREDLNRAQLQVRVLREHGAPRPVPPDHPTGEWLPLFEAEFVDLIARVQGKPVNEATETLSGLLAAYAQQDARAFNKLLHKHRQLVDQFAAQLAEADARGELAGMAAAEKLRPARVDFEAYFNHFSPFYYAAVLYLVAFVLAALSWLGWSLPLGRAANWLLLLTFVLHTFALVARIYISGRPPVTNLYSSAVFIGWACVLLALILEALYRIGIGNVVAAVTGFLTLFIAHNLSLDGDTFKVLQAVLDTQFWLATHVVCITLGYSTTLLAGMFGVIYLLFAQVSSRFDAEQRRQLTRMTYGTLCFAIFFSFVGTVLGGLWADDSWGRFWGWDPKENGALIIVLWNALVLHARWGAMIKERGLAALAVGGNIVTAWSWFGVNELGVGLHSYGFSEGRSWWLMLFVVSQLAIIAVGLFPWNQSRRPGPLAARPA